MIVFSIDREVADVAARLKKIEEAINWEMLSLENKNVLTKAKACLVDAMHVVERRPLHSTFEYEENKRLLHNAQESFLNIVRQVFPYSNKSDKIGDIIYDREWHRKSAIQRAIIEEKMWLERESKDKRYKCCRNNHCYKNLEHTCRWCGHGEIIDRVDENTPIHNRILYVGKRDGKWVLSTDPDIEGKSERIRKITIDMVGKYKQYYHLDGQNPNPFYNNDINIGDQCIKGGYLVQLCDTLIDGDLNEILIKL